MQDTRDIQVIYRIQKILGFGKVIKQGKTTSRFVNFSTLTTPPHSEGSTLSAVHPLFVTGFVDGGRAAFRSDFFFYFFLLSPNLARRAKWGA